jgi:hypothetical protein
VERSGEPCLYGKLLIQHGESFSSEAKTLTKRDLAIGIGSISVVELQYGLEVIYVYQYHGIKS